jgi:superfamily II DNA or RNA helicase
MKLRPYQLEAVENTFQSWKENRSVVGRLATGMGKTIVFADTIKRFQKRALVLAHRSELIWQARNKIEQVTGYKFQVEMGDYRAVNNFEPDLFNPENVGDAGVVATVQTLTAGGDGLGRITKFLPTDFDLLIIDESHHATSSSYRRIMDYFLQNPKLKILGVTATPNRADEESLGQIFNDVAFDKDMNYGIREGWLVPIEAQAVHIESLDFKNIKIVAGDLNQGQLSAVMESEKPLYGIADSIMEIAGDKRGIVFSPSVNHARMMADIFNRHRPGHAACVHGFTDKDERKKINSDFANGDIKIITNCGTHTEGFDDAGVEFIVPKPTKSVSLLEQMIGRGTRPHDSIAHKIGDVSNAGFRRSMIQRSVKPSCLILEYYGNRYDLATSFDLFAGNVTEDAVKEAVAMARKSGGRMSVTKSLDEEEKRAEERKKKELEETAKKAKLVVKSQFKSTSFNPFDVLGITAAKPRGWDVKKQASEKMRGVLRKMGLNPDDFDYAQTKQLVGEQLRRWTNGLCSMKQASLLKKHGFDSNVTFEVAKATIDKIASSGWKLRGNGKPVSKIKMPTRSDSYEPSTVNEPIIDGDNPY